MAHAPSRLRRSCAPDTRVEIKSPLLLYFTAEGIYYPRGVAENQRGVTKCPHQVEGI